MHDPRTTVTAVLLLLLILGSMSCGSKDHVTEARGNRATSEASPRPTWVDDPASYYDPRRPEVALAVGRAPVRGTETTARTAAAVDARVRLLAILGTAPGEVNVQESAGSTTVTKSASGTIRESPVLATWKDDNVIYVIISTPLPRTPEGEVGARGRSSRGES